MTSSTADDAELVSRMRGTAAYLRDRVGLTLDRDQEELLVADLTKAADRLERLSVQFDIFGKLVAARDAALANTSPTPS